MKHTSLCTLREARFVEAFQASNAFGHLNPGDAAYRPLPRAILSLPFRQPPHFSFLFSLFTLLLLSACSEESGDYRLAVPAEAVAICEVTLSELGTQASVSLNPFKQSLATLAGDMGGEGLQTKVEALIADPTLLGIDFGEPAYLFVMPDERIGVVMKVDDENLLGDMLTYLEKERICRPIEKGDSYSQTSVMDMVDVAYDGSTLLLTAALSRSQTPRFIAQRMEGAAAYFGEKATDNEPLLLSCSAGDDGTFRLSAENVDGSALLAQLKRVPKVKAALRMAEAVVDAEAIVRAFAGTLSVSVNEESWRLEAGLGNADFLNDMPDWAETAKQYGCAIHTLSPHHYELCTPAINLLMSVEDSSLFILRPSL